MLFVKMKNDFDVGLSLKGVSGVNKLRSQLGTIVDLSVAYELKRT